MTTVYLHGKLAEFGESFEMEVYDIAEAIRGLCSQLPDFRMMLREGYYRVLRDDQPIDPDHLDDELVLGLGAADIHIIPEVNAAGRGAGKALLGLALIAGAFFTGGATLAGIGTFSTWGNAVATIGLGLFMGGLSQMLAPKLPAQKDREDQSSFVYTGGINVFEQGGAIPYNYGKNTVVGSVVISLGVSVEDIPVDTSGSSTTPDVFSDGFTALGLVNHD